MPVAFEVRDPDWGVIESNAAPVREADQTLAELSEGVENMRDPIPEAPAQPDQLVAVTATCLACGHGWRAKGPGGFQFTIGGPLILTCPKCRASGEGKIPARPPRTP